MQARRSYERPHEVAAFAAVANYSRQPAKCDIQLSVDGNIRAIRPIEIPPMTGEGDKAAPGKVSVTFSLTHPGSAVLEIKALKRDDLPSDNAAWAILSPPRELNVLLVTAGNPALAAALRACSLARLDELSRFEFESADMQAKMAERGYDLIVLDGRDPTSDPPGSGGRPYDGTKLPWGRYLVFGDPPTGLGVSARRKAGIDVIVDWQGRHPVLQHVSLGNFVISAGRRLLLPRSARTLAEYSDGAAMAILRHRGSVFLLAGFDVMATSWPFEPGFAVFCYNTTRFLGMEMDDSDNSSTAVGSALTVRAGAASAEGAEARLTGPGKLDIALKADSMGTFRYPKAARVGIYTIAAPNRPAAKFAVNLLDPLESDIRPKRELILAGETVVAETDLGRANQELWPVLAMLALALVCVEWWVYNSKVRI